MDYHLSTVGALAGECAVFLLAGLIMVPLRFGARYKQGNAFGPDDWSVLFALFTFIGMVAVSCYGMQRQYFGYPVSKNKEVIIDTKQDIAQMYLAFDVVTVLTLGAIKLSALFFFRRIFGVTKRSSIFDFIILGSVVIVVLWTVGYVIISFFQCGTHLYAMWTPAVKEEYCLYSSAILEGLAVSDVLLDALILMIPIPKIWALSTTIQRKFAIIGVFLFGIVGLIASLYRMAIFLRIILGGLGYDKSIDYNLLETTAATLYVLEAGMGLVAVNMPSLWYFKSKVRPSSLVRSLRSLRSLSSGSLRPDRSGRKRSASTISGENGASRTENTYDTVSTLEQAGRINEPSSRARLESYGEREGIAVSHDIQLTTTSSE